MTNLQIPFDVVDLILENLVPPDGEWERLGYDSERPKHTLSSCSLVCRAWHDLSRRHIFRDVLYSFTPSENLSQDSEKVDLVDSNRWRILPSWENVNDIRVMEPCKTLQMFLHFLHDNPTLASRIRRLSLRCAPDGWYHSDSEDARRPVYFSYADSGKYLTPSPLVLLLVTLPNLTTLRLRDVHLRQDSDSTTEGLQDRLISLDQLSIAYPLSRFCPQRHLLLRVLNRYVSAKNLQVSVPDSDPMPKFGDNGHLQQIDHLVLVGVTCFSGLPRHLLGLNVSSLTLIRPEGDEFDSYNAYFHETGRNLRELRIVIEHPDNDLQAFPLDLSPCANLEKLVVAAPLSRQYPDDDISVMKFIELLATSMSALSKLREFKIHIISRIPSMFEPFTDDAIAELSQTSAPMNNRLSQCIKDLRLPALIVSLKAPYLVEENTRRYLKVVFGRLDEAKLLQFVKSEEVWEIDPDARRRLPDRRL